MGKWEHLYSGLIFAFTMGKTEKPIMGICKVDGRKRITLPKMVLNYLKLKSGDFVSIENTNGCPCLFKAFLVVRGKNNRGSGEDADKKMDVTQS